MQKQHILTLVPILSLVLAAGCGDERGPREPAGPPPLKLEVEGQGPWSIGGPQLEHFQAPDSSFDLARILEARGIKRFAMVQAGRRRIHGSRFATRQFPYRIFRRASGRYMLVGGYPEERVPFHTLKIELAHRPGPRTKSAALECTLIVGDRRERIARETTEGIAARGMPGRARVIALEDLLAHLGIEVGRGTWSLLDREGTSYRVAPVGEDGSRPYLKINRHDHVHVVLAPPGSKPERHGLTVHRRITRIQWEPADG